MSTITEALSTPPLVVPLKKTEDFDWIAYGMYILSQSELQPELFAAEVHELNEMRRRCIGCDLSKIGFRLHVIYYQQLFNITNRFIIVDAPEGFAGFAWYDSYDDSIRGQQTSIAFEKANILFNMAVMLSQIASTCHTATAEDMNGIFTAFQGSASLLLFVKENFYYPPLLDISKPSLEFLAQLMFAQAQESAARKATLMHLSNQPGLSFNTISKLWHSTAAHFADALKYLYGPNAEELRGCVKAVTALIDQKFRLSAVIARYYSAQCAYEGERIGEALGQIEVALRMCEDAGTKGTLGRQIGTMEGILKELQSKLEKENNLIFHQRPPSVLPEVQPSSIVKILSIEEVFKMFIEHRDDKDLFSRAIPKHIKYALEKFKEEGKKLIAYEEHLVLRVKSDLEECEMEVKRLDLFDSPKDYMYSRLDEKVKVEANAILQGEQVSEMHAKATRLREILKSELELNNDSLKSLSKSLFDIPSIRQEDRQEILEKIDISAAVFDSLRSDLQALPINDIEGQVQRMEQLIKEYAEGKFGEIQVPETVEKESKANAIKIDKGILMEAESDLSDLKRQIESADITSDLIKAGKGNTEICIEKKMKEYDPLAGKVESSLEKARKEIEGIKQILNERKTSVNQDKAFKMAEEQIEKRITLVDVYRSELSKLKEQLQSIQKIKTEIDQQREENKQILEIVHNKKKAVATSQSSNLAEKKEGQAKKDQEYLLNRLKQLGISPQRQ